MKRVLNCYVIPIPLFFGSTLLPPYPLIYRLLLFVPIVIQRQKGLFQVWHTCLWDKWNIALEYRSYHKVHRINISPTSNWLYFREVHFEWRHSDFWMWPKTGIFNVVYNQGNISLFNISAIHFHTFFNEHQGQFEPPEAIAVQDMTVSFYNLKWYLRQCFLVKWRKPYRLGSWPQLPHWKKNISSDQTKTLSAARCICLKIFFLPPNHFCIEALESSCRR